MGGFPHRVWLAALAAFVLAGLTGVLYRFGLSSGFVLGLNLEHVRHAHSHTMVFGWAIPVLFLLIERHTRPVGQRVLSRGWRWGIVGCLLGAVLSYPPFLLFGYSSVAVGEATLPLAVMLSSLNPLAWAIVAVAYAQRTRRVERTPALRLWDLSFLFLLLAGLGAFVLAALVRAGIRDLFWTSALTHAFLEYVIEGGFGLGLLGLFHATFKLPESRSLRAAVYVMSLSLPVTFAVGMPEALVPLPLQVAARVAVLLIAAGALLHLAALLRASIHLRADVWTFPLALATVKTAAQFSVFVFPGLWLAEQHGLRILYLHFFLLGAFTLAGLAGLDVRGRPFAIFAASVLVVLASLVPFTPLWPGSWAGTWVLHAAAWASLLPVGAAVLLFTGAPGRRAPGVGTAD